MIATKLAVLMTTLTLVGAGSPLLAAAQPIEQSGDISQSQEACTNNVQANEQENEHHTTLIDVIIAAALTGSVSLGGQTNTFGDQTFNCEAVQDADAAVNNDAAIVDNS